MTDRIRGFTVILEKNIREDDASNLQEAIYQLRGVQEVVSLIADPQSYITERRAFNEVREKLWNALFANDKPV